MTAQDDRADNNRHDAGNPKIKARTKAFETQLNDIAFVGGQIARKQQERIRGDG